MTAIFPIKDVVKFEKLEKNNFSKINVNKTGTPRDALALYPWSRSVKTGK